MHLRGVVESLVSHDTPPPIHHKSDFSLSVHITHGRGGKMEWSMTKDVTRRKTDTEGDSNGERRVVTKAATWMKKKKTASDTRADSEKKGIPHSWLYFY